MQHHAEARFLVVMEAAKDGTMHIHGLSDTREEHYGDMAWLWKHECQKRIGRLELTATHPASGSDTA